MPQRPRFSLRAPARAALRRGWITAAVVTAAGLGLLAASGPRVRFEPHVFSPIADAMTPVNTLGNAVDDFAVLNGHALVVGRLMEGESRATLPVNFAHPVRLLTALDADGDGLDEIACSWRDTVGAWVVLLGRNDTLSVLGPERDSAGTRPPLRATTVMPCASLRAPDRDRLVVCTIASMFHRPRGIVAYDAKSGAKRWYYPTGAWPMTAIAADVNGDGRDEAIAATDATENRIADSGADDGHSYALALDDRGRRLWQTQLGEGQSHVQLLVLPAANGGAPQVLASVYNHEGENPPPSRLVVLDGATGREVRAIELPQRLGQPRLVDAARGTFAVGCADGFLRVYGRELKLLAERHTGAPVEAWGSADVLGNGTRCVVVSTGHAALVLDERLRPLGRRTIRNGDVRDAVELKLARAGLRSWRVCRTSGVGLVMDLVPVPPLADAGRLAWVLLAGVFAGLLAMAWRRRPRRLPSMSEARDFLVDYRQVRHDVFDDQRPFGRLWNWAHESVAGTPAPAGVFEQARAEFLALGVETLGRFAVRAKDLWVDEKLVRRIRERLDTLRRVLADAGADPPPGHARAIAAAMRELSDACAEAYREVASREPCRADQVAMAAVEAKRPGLMERGIAIELRIDPGGATPVLFGCDDLRSIVGQLIENAAGALAGREGGRIGVTVGPDRPDPRRILLVVSDNGPGIPPDARERVFRPDVSSREGGGFGLGHARETARIWRGDLVIEDAAGGGAALRLVLARLLPFEEHK